MESACFHGWHQLSTAKDLFGVGRMYETGLKATCAFLQAGGREDRLRKYHLFGNHP